MEVYVFEERVDEKISLTKTRTESAHMRIVHAKAARSLKG